jgi:N-acetylglutamate synthase-like GNAT family acetyltransferase
VEPFLPIVIRPATAADQALITKLVRDAHLNPLRLGWVNFLVAEQVEEMGPRVVGIGQLRPHKDGIQELASLVVKPQARGSGVGGQLVKALIDKAERPLYLMCDDGKRAYYERFDFYEVRNIAEVPRSLRGLKRIANVVGSIFARFTEKPPHLAIMVHRGL